MTTDEVLVWVDGVIAPAERATVPALDQTALIGDGVFETLRLIDGQVRFLDRHLTRLDAACARTSIRHPGDERVREALDALLTTSQRRDGRVRIAVTGGVSGLGPGRGSDSSLIVSIGPAMVPTAPARLLRGPWVRNERSPLTGVKSSSWAENAALLRLARDAGCDDVLLSDSAGRLSECAAANVFVVVDGRLLTPALTSGCLPGIVRSVVLEAGIADEATIDEASLPDVTEAFVTSSFVGVRPVAAIGDRALPVVDGEATTRARALL